jgi:RNA polymerase sigma-70 factor (ECF subfamily)
MGGPGQDFDHLLAAAARGDSSAMAELLNAIQPPLLHFVASRLDPRVASRIDPADVVQNALLSASRRLAQFRECGSIPFSLWLNQIALEQIAYVHRMHIRSKKRSVCRELPQVLLGEGSSRTKSAIDDAVSHEPSASASVEAEEQRACLEQGLENLPIHEQNLLHLRFFEHLEFKVVAEQLGITVEALRMRQIRALRRLRTLIRPDDGQC